MKCDNLYFVIIIYIMRKNPDVDEYSKAPRAASEPQVANP